MRSICGALARPSRRPTGRRSFTSTSVGMSVTLSLSAHSGDSDTSILAMRSRPRSLRARWASKLSIRRAGPDVEAVKKRRTGRPFLVGCTGGGVGPWVGCCWNLFPSQDLFQRPMWGICRGIQTRRLRRGRSGGGTGSGTYWTLGRLRPAWGNRSMSSYTSAGKPTSTGSPSARASCTVIGSSCV